MRKKFFSLVFSFLLMALFMIKAAEGRYIPSSSSVERGEYSAVEKKEVRPSTKAVVPGEKPEVVTKPKVEKETKDGTILIFIIIAGGIGGWIYLRPSKKKEKKNKTK